MIVNATDLKNNLGKYLRLSATEDIIVSSNGRKMARLSAYTESEIPPVGKCEFEYEPYTKSRKQFQCSEDDQTHTSEKAHIYGTFPRRATYEEFLELVAGTDEHEQYEYIDGEIYQLASPKVIHQKISGQLYGAFFNWFKTKKCIPMFSPFDITLKRGNGKMNVVQPDLIVICDLEEKTNERGYYMGVPALAVEILSDSSRREDCIKKLDLYMSTGIKEYWVVNPLNREVTVYLFTDNDFNQNITYKNDETAASFIFEGLQMNLPELFP